MRKKRLVCLLLSVLMVFSLFAVNISAAEAGDSAAEVGCDPIWFEVQALLDEAYECIEAEDLYTYESRMALAEIADSVNVISSDESTVRMLQEAIDALVPFTTTDDSYCEDTSVVYVTDGSFGSAHPYANYTYKTWIIKSFDAQYIELMFSSNTYLEEGWDFIYILDEYDNVMEQYTGDELAGKNVFVPGDTVKVVLDTDQTVTAYGFECCWTSSDNFGDLCETTIRINDEIYTVNVGDTVNYTVELSAEELFENIQATVTYDSDALKILPNYLVDYTLPNLSGAVINMENQGYVKFNHSDISGIDFRDEKVLVTLTFLVKEDIESEIDFSVQFMTIKGGNSHYFLHGVPQYTRGIEFTESLSTPSMILGDADCDSVVSIKDATAIQKHVAWLLRLEGIQLELADADQNGIVNVKDATVIQKYIADYDVNGEIGNEIDIICTLPTESWCTEPEPTETWYTETCYTEPGLIEPLYGIFPVYDGYNTVVLQADTWENAFVYVWDNEGCGEYELWPGEAMICAGMNGYGERLFYAHIPECYENYIFSNGNDEWTVDLTIENSTGIYLDEALDEWTFSVGFWDPEFYLNECTDDPTELFSTESETEIIW